ncbi:MAG: methionyl-tRNA formyltransferase [Flavobacteriaceae bacterium]
MSLKVVFMGTPDFAVTALAAIHASQHKIVGVITNIDKAAGRGKKIRTSAVKEYALEQQLPLFQPPSLKDPAFIDEMTALNADVFVVVAFRMLPKVLWSIPPLGTFNLHASLLPNYRGAAPINWAIINRERYTGVTTFLIDEKIDTGQVLLQEKIQIEKGETAGSLHDKLAPMGGGLIVTTLDELNNGITPLPQQLEGNEHDAPKLTKENTQIDWNKSLLEIEALINGLSPYPVAWTNLIEKEKEERIKIYEASAELCKHDYSPLSLVVENKGMKIAHPDGFLHLNSVQLPNKRRMQVRDLLNGQQFSSLTQVK